MRLLEVGGTLRPRLTFSRQGPQRGYSASQANPRASHCRCLRLKECALCP